MPPDLTYILAANKLKQTKVGIFLVKSFGTGLYESCSFTSFIVNTCKSLLYFCFHLFSQQLPRRLFPLPIAALPAASQL